MRTLFQEGIVNSALRAMNVMTGWGETVTGNWFWFWVYLSILYCIVQASAMLAHDQRKTAGEKPVPVPIRLCLYILPGFGKKTSHIFFPVSEKHRNLKYQQETDK
jgi:hypothetical protein